jgi:heterotetrameric sarcosine oxidase gamma subunit
MASSWQQASASKRLSPFHHKQTSLEARFTTNEFGWAIAEQFFDPVREKEAAERKVGCADLSHLTKLSLNGQGLVHAISELYGSGVDLRPQLLANGRGLVKDAWCAIFSGEEAMLVSSETVKQQLLTELSAAPREHFTVTDVSSALAGCYLIGRNSRSLLHKLTELNVNAGEFPNLSVTRAAVRHVPMVVLRNDIGILLAYQLYFERSYAEFVWDVVFSAGQELGVAPVGSSAMRLLGLSLR